jgi:hypothetical protein
MKAANLITLAGPHSINLTQAARQTTRDAQQHPQRPSFFARLRSTTEPNPCVVAQPTSARGRQTRVARKPRWSLAELGQAAQGVDRIPMLALLYTYGGDRSAYWPLRDALVLEAIDLRTRHRWPAQVRDRHGNLMFYMEELAALVLDEDANLPKFRAEPTLYAQHLRVQPETWERTLSHRFDSLKLRYLGWLQSAEHSIEARTSDDGEALCTI